jgi:hypothetical protein
MMKGNESEVQSSEAFHKSVQPYAHVRSVRSPDDVMNYGKFILFIDVEVYIFSRRPYNTHNIMDLCGFIILLRNSQSASA